MKKPTQPTIQAVAIHKNPNSNLSQPFLITIEDNKVVKSEPLHDGDLLDVSVDIAFLALLKTVGLH